VKRLPRTADQKRAALRSLDHPGFNARRSGGREGDPSNDSHLIHQITTYDGQPVGSPEDLGHASGVAVVGAPAAVSWGNSPDRVDVFGRGSDNALWHKWYTTSGGWSGWESLGGTLSCSPTVASWGTNRLDVFACDTSNHLTHKYFNGGWSSWESGTVLADSGQTLTSAPAAVAWGNGRIDIFARDTNNNLIQKAYDSGAGGWQTYPQNDWYNLGGTLTSAPSVSSSGSQKLDIYMRNTRNGLSHLAYRNTSGWQWKTATTLDSPSGSVAATAPTLNDGYSFAAIRDTNNGLKYGALLN